MRVNKEILEHAINRISESMDGQRIDELHHYAFNEDYFIVGYYEAEKFCNSIGVFECMRIIKNWHDEQGMELSTDLSNSEDVANMTAYILGENLFNDLKSLPINWDKEMNDEIRNEILTELNKMVVWTKIVDFTNSAYDKAINNLNKKK